MTRTALPVPRTVNITRAFRAASVGDLLDGREWYVRASRLAAELDPDNVNRSAAVIAVLSPQLPWSRNVAIARQAYAMYAEGADVDTIAATLPLLRSNARKAARILHGADPADVVSGPKVTAFWRTIADPTDPRAVVVDRHAIDVAVGRVLDDETRGKLLGRRGAYDTVCDLYRRAARILSRELGEPISPAVVQAVTWMYWRRERAHHMARALARTDAAAFQVVA